MNDRDVIRELKSLGAEQTRKTYLRHGVGDKVFGVSYAQLGKLQKKIKVDHGLAGKLWATGFHEAQILAAMIADPAQMSAKEIDTWARSVSNYMQSDALAGLVSKTRFAAATAEKWTRSNDEWIGSAGWQVLSWLAQRDATLPDSFFLSYLETIENKIHEAMNRVRYAMNGALIGIGSRNIKLEKKALAVAAKIGKVKVDHGDTACKTPDAASYIRKTAAYKMAKAARG
ncbi:MAG TPA: DNA alkylation repair protein [Pyrinomonadaceae bacterium]|nr:DNA alkylation repair protein [Pyrinomonadaceae bacterium]